MKTGVTYPAVSEVRKLAKKHELLRCVVFFTAADGRMGYTSFGKTQSLCESTRRVADGLWSKYRELTNREAAEGA